VLSYDRDSEGRPNAVSGKATHSQQRLVTLRLESELTAQKREIWRLWGLSKEFGLVGNNSTGECAGREIIDELTGFLLRAVALDTQPRIATSAGRGVGRLRNVMSSYLAPELHSTASRSPSRIRMG
jgi:hypothetical protein